MTDKELRILFLKMKLEHESKKLSSDDFFELIKDKIGWKQYNDIYSEYAKNSLLDYQTHAKLTELGKNTLIALENELEQETKDKLAERKKLHNESVISDWKRKTFWYIFAFGLFGGIYSGIDLFNKLTKNEKTEEIKSTEQISEPQSQISPLIQKNKDSIVTQQKNDSVSITKLKSQ